MPDREQQPQQRAVHNDDRNGTCGRLHGVVVERLAAHGATLARLEEHTQRQWSAIGDRLRVRLFCWIAGALVAVMAASAGTFAIAQRAAVEEHSQALADCAERGRETDQRYQDIQADLREIAVHVEYLRAQAERVRGRDQRLDDRPE